MKYTSKQVQIFRSDEFIFEILSSFSNFTPILADKVEGWQATDERCSFKVQGFTIGLVMAERTPFSTIKVIAQNGESPVPFSFWIQLKSVGDNDTRLRVVLDAELNMMMKMIIGSKLQDAIDRIADQIAVAFNSRGDMFADWSSVKSSDNSPGDKYIN